MFEGKVWEGFDFANALEVIFINNLFSYKTISINNRFLPQMYRSAVEDSSQMILY